MTEKHATTLSKFLCAAEEYWRQIYAGNTKGANSATKSMTQVVKQWDADGIVQIHLEPLLISESPAIRFAAAAYLMNYVPREKPVNVLRRLIITEKTLISTSASTSLRLHNIAEKE